VWTNIYPNIVSEYIKQLQIHKRNEVFIDNVIANFIENNSIPELKMWDVAIASGEGELIQITDGLPILYKSKRQILVEDTNGGQFNWLQVSSRRKVGSGNSITLGLSDQEKARAHEMKQKAQASSASIREYYTTVRSRPIIIIYFIEPVIDNINAQVMRGLESMPLVALSLQFPRYMTNSHPLVTYALNPVKVQQLGFELDDGDDDGDTN
jgi:hypothetical protein